MTRRGAFVRHVRGLWPGPGVWAPLVFVVWALTCFAFRVGRLEHALVLVVVPLLAYGNAATKKLFIGLFPMGLLGILYDSMRWFQNVGLRPDTIHVCDLRALDMKLVSVTVNGARGSVHDYAQLHTSRVIDAIAAVPYGTFLYVTIAFAVFLYVKDYPRMQRFAWSFLFLNLVGFVTYHLYPAAPPWYFHQHGCVVDLTTRATEGPNLARVDAMLGVAYFHGLYGRASSVFGAVPSLHVGYPSLIALFGWPILKWPGRIGAAGFLALMCFAAVYLDHHWLVDVIVGVLYAALVVAAVTTVCRAYSTRTARTAPDDIVREVTS